MMDAMTSRSRVLLAGWLALVGLAGAVFLGVNPSMHPTSEAASSTIPEPDVDEPVPASSTLETTVLAGGCFWGVQGVFQHVKGVTAAESGYAGGDAATANYDTVSGGETGHAESVRITYDPTQVTFGQLLHVYFAVVADPTQLNRQGPDVGTQYRSAIFAQNATQQKVAAAYVAQLDGAGVFPAKIVTTVSPKAEFFPAEAYHQDFLNSNPSYPYIAAHDMPKLDALKTTFPAEYRAQPVLMLAAGGQ
jgi:peptide-methionine (S)-S-oxide reductase